MSKLRFYETGRGLSPVQEFLDGASLELRRNFIDAVNLLIQGQTLSMPLSRSFSSIHHGLHELRLKDRAGQIRVFYFIKKQGDIYIIHAFRKKTRELPRREVRLILKRIREI